MQFRSISSRRDVVKASAFAISALGLGNFTASARQTPAASPEITDGSFTSVDGNLHLTWDPTLWETWEADDLRVVIGSDGDGSAPYAYRFRSTVSERFWDDGESQLASIEETGTTLNREDITVIDTAASIDSLGYVRRMQSPGGEAFSIFEFKRVSEDSNLWVSSEAWIHVDAFDVDDAIAQYSTLALNNAPVPALWDLEDVVAMLAEHAD